MEGAPLLALLQLCDTLFPLGGFSHSEGLEAATSCGDIATADDLDAWLESLVREGLARCEGLAAAVAHASAIDADWQRLIDVEAEMHAIRPSSTIRAASRSMGTRLLKTWRHIHPGIVALPRAVDQQLAACTLPVAFGVACASTGIPRRPAIEGFIYTRLASTVSSAMRLMPLGQHDAHRLLARWLREVPQAVDQIEAAVLDDVGPSAFMPAFDIAAMAQQYVGSRLFRS